MKEMVLTKQQARRFLLIKQGLLGDYRFTGKEGIMEFVRQAGCIQFDPIDACGKNAELVLQSRVKGFCKAMLYGLLYHDRRLIDYFDKNLAIMETADWPYFERYREAHRRWSPGMEEVDKVADGIIEAIGKKGPLCSKELELNEKVNWYWSATKLSRAALESLYFRGDLIIHHKKGTFKYYALARDYIDKELLQAPDPYPEETEHLKWRVLRRIGAVGMLWNRPSDAWLNIWNLKAQERSLVFGELLKEEKITLVRVEGCKDAFYCLTSDLTLLNEALGEGQHKGRTELMAPLDNLLWDRKLIAELFDFDYKWEIYTPEVQRKYGYYVLPILMGERFIGRCEVVSDTRTSTLRVKNIWYEAGVRNTKKLTDSLDRCFRRFMKFHGLKDIEYACDLK